jgi:hypothetical protein
VRVHELSGRVTPGRRDRAGGRGAAAHAGRLLLGHAAGVVVGRVAVDGVDVAAAGPDDPVDVSTG